MRIFMRTANECRNRPEPRTGARRRSSSPCVFPKRNGAFTSNPSMSRCLNSGSAISHIQRRTSVPGSATTKCTAIFKDFYADGKRVQESTGTANRSEAEKFVALRLSEAQRGVYVKPVHVPLPELWERYIAYSKAHKRSWKRDDQMYRNLQGFFGPVNLETLTPLSRGLPAAPRPGSLAGNRQS